MSKSLFAAVAFLALGAVAAPAFAEEVPVQAVSTAGVDFRDAAQVKALYNRLYRAADAVCRTESANSRVAQSDQVCIAKALAGAVRSADRPLLTATYEKSASKSGQMMAQAYR